MSIARAAAAFSLLFLVSMALPVASVHEPYPGQCRTIVASDADARGEGLAIYVQGPVVGTVRFTDFDAMQDGPGKRHADGEFLDVTVPAGSEDPILQARVASGKTDLEVEEHPLESESWTTVSVADLNILDGMITAKTLRSSTYAIADVRHAHTDSTPSVVQDLRVNGVSVTNVAPNTRVPLPATLGPDSYVVVYEREDHSRFPGGGSILYEANVTVRMVRVHITDYQPLTAGLQPLEIVISEAHSYAAAPTPWCGLRQSIEAGAYVARIRPHAFEGESVLVGEARIGHTGGKASQTLANESLPSNGNLIYVGTAESSADGVVIPNVKSESHAVEQLGDICIQRENETDCFITVELVKAESNSVATASGRGSHGSVVIARLIVGGIDVCEELGLESTCTPPKNTKREIAGVKIILNERQRDPEEMGHTGYAVRAIRIESPGLGIIIIGRAYSAADYFDPAAGMDGNVTSLPSVTTPPL
jgi:hypothetical protein